MMGCCALRRSRAPEGTAEAAARPARTEALHLVRGQRPPPEQLRRRPCHPRGVHVLVDWPDPREPLSEPE